MRESEEMEQLREEFDKIVPEKRRMRREFKNLEARTRAEMIEADMMVAVMTGDATKLATTGSYRIPNSLEKRAFAALGEMEQTEIDERGHKILEQIKTPVEKEGMEAIADKIMKDEKLLTRLYNLTEGWKEKYNDDSRDYSDEEQKQACLEALEELVGTDKDGLDFILDVRDKESRYEGTVDEENSGRDADDEWNGKMKEAREWAEGAMELGKVIYGHQFEYAEGFERRITARVQKDKFDRKAEAAFGPRVEVSEEEEPEEEKPVEPVEPEGRVGYQENGLIEGITKLKPTDAGALHIVDRMTAEAGKPLNQRIRDIFKTIKLAPSFRYTPKGGGVHYEFSRPFLLDGDRALIYYHSYGVKQGEGALKVYYDPVVLVEGEKEGEMKAVEKVELAIDGIDVEPKLKTRTLSRDTDLEAVSRSIIDSQDAVNLATEYGQREGFPMEVVRTICRQTGGKDKVAFKSSRKVVE